MDKDCVSLLQWDDLEQFNVWRDAIGSCGASLSSGVPVWQSFYQHLKSGKRRGGLERVYDSGMGYMSRGVRHVGEITDASRYSFWLAFGIHPDLQLALEHDWPTICYGDGPTPMRFADLELLSGPLLWLERSEVQPK